MRKTLKKLAAFTLAATMLAGCSGSSTSATTAATTAAQKENVAATEASATTAAPVVEDVDYKDEVVVGIAVAVDNMDPADTTKIYCKTMYMSTHNTLISMDENTLEFSPELATEWKWVDDVTLEMKLRDDVTFHDGSKFTADDVVFTFERMVEEKRSNVSTLESVVANDDYSITIKMKTPNMDWESIIADTQASIVSRAACAADPEEGSIIGTGPWKLDSWTAGDYVDLVRNEEYWGEVPKTEKLTLRYIAENSARVIALQNGEIDLCLEASVQDAQYVAEDDNLELIQFPSTSLYYLAFDVSEAPGDDQNLRLALAHCINVEDIITVAANGTGTPAITDWGKNTIGYYDGFGAYEYNPELAKEYLEKSYPNGGAKIRFTCSSSLYATILSVIQEQARAIGLEIEIEQVESAAQSAMSKYEAAEHEALAYGYGWDAGTIKAKQRYYPDSNNNKAIINNERINELFDLGLAEQDVEKRKEYYKEIQEMNHEQAWYIPLYYGERIIGVNKDASGYILTPSGSHDLSYLVVEE